MTARCDCCDLPASSCGKATETRQRQEQAGLRRSLLEYGWFPARYPGSCCHCGEVFGVDALIHRDGEGWLAECCAP